MTYLCVCVYMCIGVNIEGRKRGGEGNAETKRSRGKQEMNICAFSERRTRTDVIICILEQLQYNFNCKGSFADAFIHSR